MKHFRCFWFSFMALVITATLMSCKGNGKTTPQSQNLPSFAGDAVVINFDASKLKVVANGSKAMTSGQTVKVGTYLNCTLHTGALDVDKIFDGFVFNGKKQTSGIYIVDAKDATAQGSITISFAQREKSSEKLKIVFSQNISAQLTDASGRRTHETLSSGGVVSDGQVIRFEAQVSSGKVLESWVVNEKSKDVTVINRNVLLYIASVSEAKGDAGKKEIEVKFTEKEASKIHLQFDEETIESISNAKRGFKQDDEVISGDMVYIEPKKEKIKAGKAVEYWTCNGGKCESIISDGSYFSYIVDEKDAKKEGDKLIIKIGAVFRDALKVKVKFDDTKISIISHAGDSGIEGKEVKNGDEVYENTWLEGSVKELGDSVVDKWLCNKKEVTPIYSVQTLELFVTRDVAKKEGGEWVLDIEVVTRVAKKFTLKFEPPITCSTWEKGNRKDIASGTQVKEGDDLQFGATVPEGKVADSWLVNGVAKEKFKKRGSFWYEVVAKDAKNDVIEISLSMQDAQSGKLILEKDNITARNINDRSGSDLSSGSQIKEGDELDFSIKNISNDKIVDAWIINGTSFQIGKQGENLRVSNDGRSMWLIVTKDFLAKEGDANVFKVSYQERSKEEIKIDFDDSKIECKVADEAGGTKAIASGDKVKEGSRLQFEAKEGVFVQVWIVGDGDAHRYGGSKTFRWPVHKAYAVAKGSDFVMKVSIERREPYEISINFDSNKTECKRGSETIVTGTKVKEGTELTFIAKGVQNTEGKKILWTFSRRAGDGYGDVTFKHKVSSDYAERKRNGSNDEYVYNVSWKER